ncbi:hypothetical protein [Methylocystis sp. SB2]|uniref:hypothetical protein n=1 Tax=Methylocystis sp. (strain SB2) TaxID=743836 RepID=UPI000419B55C|nr:hypothetical protein [Methylocystis sp. SB2]ULO24177.1 hypothetical protein LNB28_01840 [Methylocystis sp. SB2]
MSPTNKNQKQSMLDNAMVTTIADYLRAMLSGVTAEPLPAAMDKLLQRIEQRV